LHLGQVVIFPPDHKRPNLSPWNAETNTNVFIPVAIAGHLADHFEQVHADPHSPAQFNSARDETNPNTISRNGTTNSLIGRLHDLRTHTEFLEPFSKQCLLPTKRAADFLVFRLQASELRLAGNARVHEFPNAFLNLVERLSVQLHHVV
jgi:hypothetical protein